MESQQKIIVCRDLIKGMKIVDIWPTTNQNFLFYCRCVFRLTSIAIVMMGMMGHIYYSYNNDMFKYVNISDDFSGISSIFGVYNVVFNFVRHYNVYNVLFKELGDFSVYEKPRGVDELNKKLDMVIRIFSVWVIISFFCVTSVLYMMKCEEGIVDDCGLMVNFWLPFFDLRSRSKKTMVMVYQVYGGCVGIYLVTFSFLTIIFISELTINRIHHLLSMIKQVPGMKFNYTHFAHALSWANNLCLICFIGQRLINASSDLHDGIFPNIPWDGDVRTQKSMHMLMIRSSRPHAISAGLMGCCGHLLLMSLIKSMYTFMMLIYDRI
ncbi:PREDICTED: uncharacterized protein LOC108567115 [Nicrophorus vespilloides]|uniref:Uncharacterized protein LOC108567115 n=1 Tax=Nicrophorus vespilloides TaxID=110193 RepID=A0ABM1N7S7_NICVS|nr:PREDICTED: uncharacterized protein LOC108567115 [Nicrophorus vespilloides]